MYHFKTLFYNAAFGSLQWVAVQVLNRRVGSFDALEGEKTGSQCSVMPIRKWRKDFQVFVRGLAYICVKPFKV